jgi:hypothetical protein
MFAISDLTTVVVIKDALVHLSQNPEHLEFVLGVYRRCPALADLVGPEHLKQCIDYVTGNRIVVAPYYELDQKMRPSISVVAGGNEEQQFIGEHGSFQESCLVLSPYVYAQFDAKGRVDNDASLLQVPSSYGLTDTIWKGIYVTNGNFKAKLEGMKVDGSTTTLYLDEDIPTDVSLKGWQAESSDRRKGYRVLASMDEVTVQCKLTTVGDYSIHRLLSIVLRYCLKSRRMLFDSYGLQVATFSYTPPIMTDPDENEFETIHTVNAKITEQWIEEEVPLLDDAAKLEVEVNAQREGEEPFVVE